MSAPAQHEQVQDAWEAYRDLASRVRGNRRLEGSPTFQNKLRRAYVRFCKAYDAWI